MSAGGTGGTMRAAVWKARAALVYSLGGWTMLGAMLHYNFTSGNSAETGGSTENESDLQANQGPHKEVFVKEMGLGLKVTTVVTYRETEAPITKLLRRVTSFFYPPDNPPSEN